MNVVDQPEFSTHGLCAPKPLHTYLERRSERNVDTTSLQGPAHTCVNRVRDQLSPVFWPQRANHRISKHGA